MTPATLIPTPSEIAPDRHLKVGVNDIITTQDSLVSPGHSHVRAILDYGQAWDTTAPLLIHCWAGVSRSTASAFIIACQRNPHIDPAIIASAIRHRSPTATPNRLLVSIGDEILGRGGAMVAAIDAIGRGVDCWEGTPFDIPADWPAAGLELGDLT